MILIADSEGPYQTAHPCSLIFASSRSLVWAFAVRICPKICFRMARPKWSTGLEVIKLFSCLTQLSMKIVLLINLKLLTTTNCFLLNIAEHENFSANEYENANYSYLSAEKILCSAELSMKTVL